LSDFDLLPLSLRGGSAGSAFFGADPEECPIDLCLLPFASFV